MTKNIILLILLITLGSCGNYNKIRFHKAKQSNKEVSVIKNNKKEVNPISIDTEKIENTDLATTDDNIGLNPFLQTKHRAVLNLQEGDSCDVVLFRDGEEIEVIVLEVGIDEVKYKKCHNVEGPTYTIKKDEVFYIKYRNGHKDVFKIEEKAEKNIDKADMTSNNQRKQHPTGIVGLTLSLSMIPPALVISWLFLLLSIPALILGIIGFSKASKHPGMYKKSASGWALFLGILGIVAMIIILIVLFI